MGHRARPAARRRLRQPHRPRLPRARRLPGPRRGLHRPGPLRGLQPRRLRDHLRWRADRPPLLPRHRPRRHPPPRLIPALPPAAVAGRFPFPGAAPFRRPRCCAVPLRQWVPTRGAGNCATSPHRPVVRRRQQLPLRAGDDPRPGGGPVARFPAPLTKHRLTQRHPQGTAARGRLPCQGGRDPGGSGGTDGSGILVW
ncbi:hypothetical protein SCOCK_310074 [Actinacidiphila cocklensis]|uniref:Uncharacterized protein n=1 Tax=Actinacidiphila cocklensis TaxID=887465 RepID=A0A9W4DTP8_9ACTN|nr:hypothetical protein SCOCK_310074 [Actinacidiphila cocklensis]